MNCEEADITVPHSVTSINPQIDDIIKNRMTTQNAKKIKSSNFSQNTNPL